MDAARLLQIARDIVAKVPFCFAITVDRSGDANARIIQASKLREDWTLRFMTDRRSRKVPEIARTGRLTLAYEDDADKAYVTLIGRATIVDDVAVKQAVWRPESFKWHPGGPTDPNVVLVDFTTERIELWSSAHAIVPDPHQGLWAAVLTRDGEEWRCRDSIDHAEHRGATQPFPGRAEGNARPDEGGNDDPRGEAALSERTRPCNTPAITP